MGRKRLFMHVGHSQDIPIGRASTPVPLGSSLKYLDIRLGHSTRTFDLDIRLGHLTWTFDLDIRPGLGCLPRLSRMVDLDRGLLPLIKCYCYFRS